MRRCAKLILFQDDSASVIVVVQPFWTRKCTVHETETNRKHMHSCRDIAPGTHGSTMLLVCNLSPFLAPHPLIPFWLVTGDIQKASNNIPRKETVSHQNHQTSISLQNGLCDGPQVIATCFERVSYCTMLQKRLTWCFGATYWSVTKNLDILSPRSHGNNPDQCRYTNVLPSVLTTIHPCEPQFWNLV